MAKFRANGFSVFISSPLLRLDPGSPVPDPAVNVFIVAPLGHELSSTSYQNINDQISQSSSPDFDHHKEMF